MCDFLSWNRMRTEKRKGKESPPSWKEQENRMGWKSRKVGEFWMIWREKHIYLYESF